MLFRSAWDALRWETDSAGNPPPPAERVARSARQGLFAASWLVAIPGAMWKLATRSGRVRYDKMAYHGSEADVLGLDVLAGASCGLADAGTRLLEAEPDDVSRRDRRSNCR